MLNYVFQLFRMEAKVIGALKALSNKENVTSKAILEYFKSQPHGEKLITEEQVNSALQRGVEERVNLEVRNERTGAEAKRGVEVEVDTVEEHRHEKVANQAVEEGEGDHLSKFSDGTMKIG
ncbi:hypothetical protein J437_LFUL002982 [Ladona fulva]|uniref:Uncharacterized protein n=1 Tax=Ladona fulva TaxID=123851 RepID=A0A8K0NUF6_LADFU|nr:hypothetical protein J437_LFUL002982 [Ladona fulva]